MKLKALSVVAAVVGMTVPSVISACEWSLNRSYIGIPSGLNLGIGVTTPTDDLFGSMAVNAGLGIGLGGRFAIVPSVGMCIIGAEDGEEDFSEMMFGGAAALRLIGSADSKFSLNAQAGISILSYDPEITETSIPIQAAGQYKASDNAALFFGAGIVMSKFKSDFFDESDSDPVVFGGISLMIKRLMLSGGLGAVIGDDDTDLDLTIGLKVPLGGS